MSTMEGLNPWQRIWYWSSYEDCINIFPCLYYKTNKNGEKYGEPIFMELKFCHDIIGTHYNDMIMPDGRNKVAFGRTEIKCPTLFNIKQYFIRTKMMPSRKPVGESSVNDTNQYINLDKLKNKLFDEDLYTLVDLADEVMGISKDNIQDRIKRSKACAKFFCDLGDNFPIGMFFLKGKVHLAIGMLCGRWNAVKMIIIKI